MKEIDDFRVIKIINQFQVVLNKGSLDGINEFQKFLVYELGDEIEDPKTKKKLGRLEIVKGRIKPLHIQENMTSAESDEYTTEKSQKLISYSSFVESQKQKPLNKQMKVGDWVKIISTI
jgi:hypothetical protein